MFKSACDVMKKSVVFSASLLMSGVLLEIIAQFLSLNSMVPIFFAYAGVFAIGLGALVLLGTFIAIMLPNVNQQLKTCQH